MQDEHQHTSWPSSAGGRACEATSVQLSRRPCSDHRIVSCLGETTVSSRHCAAIVTSIGNDIAACTIKYRHDLQIVELAEIAVRLGAEDSNREGGFLPRTRYDQAVPL